MPRSFKPAAISRSEPAVDLRSAMIGARSLARAALLAVRAARPAGDRGEVELHDRAIEHGITVGGKPLRDHA
jgi:hypothetical protein